MNSSDNNISSAQYATNSQEIQLNYGRTNGNVDINTNCLEKHYNTSVFDTAHV